MLAPYLLIVDDHPLFASALADLLRSIDPALDVGIAGSFSQARECIARRGAPQLLLLDLDLPDSPPSRSLDSLAGAFGDAPIVICSALDDEQRIRQATAAGAIGFISKSLRPAELVRQMTRLIAGERVFPAAAAVARTTPLSQRQRDVMEGVACGQSNKEIARQLDLSPGTVKVHLREIYARLGAKNRTEALALYQALLKAESAS